MSGLTHRIAAPSDAPALAGVMDAAIAELQKGFLDPAQIASSRMIMGLDRQLLADGTYFISDAGSRNGTFVGGRRLDSTEVALPFGAKLTVGDWDLRFSRLADTIGLLRSS